ncbi:family 2 glycosyl transferase [Alteromonas macleodii str. 'Balearic Sea AD45']|uniref:glycosyltransferase n=1 Tax=Alteromonas macleodii TaxID=28108 RepID=UPI000286F8A0|nr:glycosyltransferase [Alteromonas macleodii]AFT96879.1 family 2 glycosyl transferase [Alteromonas macleodii str. 'Balearic Sea AD45']
MTKKEYFDPEWYLKQYPDVAAAGIDPKLHFDKHGRREGRLPCSIPSLSLEKALWANVENCEAELNSLSEAAECISINGIYAAKVLVDYYLFTEQYHLAKEESDKLVINSSLSEKLFSRDELSLLRFSSLFGAGLEAEAKQVVEDPHWLNSSKWLAASMLSDSRKIVEMNKLYKNTGLTELTTNKAEAALDVLSTARTSASAFTWLKALVSKSKVSIIVPVFNAEKVISTSINSLLNQSWKNIEIIAVDDASTDNSYTELKRLYGGIDRVRIIKNNKNKGAYATRNLGMTLASGNFLTVMDADDWAHPQKIEKQVIPLLFNRSLKGTVSHWVRCTEDLEFSRLRVGNSWVHRNVSSLLVRKDVVASLGGWDEVKVNADTEFYERCLAKFGKAAIKEVMPDVPLSFGRTHASSLTQNAETHLVTQYGGVRKQYMDCARAWHKNSPGLQLLRSEQRPFPVPPSMLLASSKPSFEKENTARFQKWSKALDENWYAQIYDDVSSMGLDIHDHFWGRGEKEGRYPSPLFNPQAYAYKFELPNTVSPTWHALHNDSWDFSAPISIKGFANNEGEVHVALFGHAVSETVFGAERSLVDIAEAMQKANISITLFLPSCSNITYIEELKQFVRKIVFLPLPWANGREEPIQPVAQYLESDFLHCGYDCVYVNTLTLIEPLSAAKKAGIPMVMHVRELVEFDNDLADLLRESPQRTHARVIATSDYFIANSEETARWINEPERTTVIYNCVDTSPSQNSMPSGALKICMLSSNVKKKGVEDFFEVASLCKEASNIQFTIYGPITNEVIMAAKRFGDANITIAGYVEKPKEAMAEHHIVLALSHFKESFGRTVAEAMSLGRVVVGYDWGAVNELVDKQSGILVDYKSTEKIVDAILDLNCNPKLVASMGNCAAKRAKELFSRDTFGKKLVNQIVMLSKKSGKI